jgi:hypothetical protein
VNVNTFVCRRQFTMKLIRTLTLAFILQLATPVLMAQVEQWTAELGTELVVADIAALNDGTVILALTTREWRETASSTLLRFTPGESAAAEMASLSGLGVNDVEALEGNGASLLVRGAVGEQ